MSFLSKHPTASALATFAVLVLIFYGNTLGNGFVFDDRSVIERNPYAHSWQYLHKVVTGCAWEASLVNGCSSTGIHYRPVQALSFLLAWHVAPAAWPFHLFNIIYFFISASLVFVFVKLLTKNFFLAFSTGLLFLIHPVNNEAVNFVSLVPDFGLAIFTISAGIYYFLYRTKGGQKNLIWVYVFYFLSLLSKEPAFIVVPLSLLALDLIVLKLPIRTFFRWSSELKTYLFLAIPTAIYFAMRLAVLGFHGALLTSASSAGGATLIERIYVFFTLFKDYLGEILYPLPLRFFHNFTVSDNLLSVPFIFSFFLTILFFTAVYFAIRKGERTFAFFLTWIVIFFFPVLIFFDMADMKVFFDRYFFISSIGFAFVVGYALDHIWHNRSVPFLSLAQHPSLQTKRIAVAAVLGILAIGSFAVIFPRNSDWKNWETMYTKTLQQTPDAHIIRRELADAYFEQGDYEKGRPEYEYLIANAQNWRDVTMAYKGMGDYWRAQGDADKALEYYLQAIQTSHMQPRDWVPLNIIGTLYEEKGEDLIAFTYFCQSVQLFPTEQNNQNFQAALTSVDETIIKKNTLTLVLKEKFQPAQEKNIEYLDKRCNDKSCQYAFVFNPQSRDIIAPPLITASTQVKKQQTTIPITNSSFDPIQNVIILETDAKYEDEELTFVFPTCSRTYYEVATSQ